MKTNKRIAAMLTSGVLALTPCVAAGMTAFADGETPTYTITINELNVHDTENPTYSYTAYQIFSGDISEDGETLTNIDWATGFNGNGFLSKLKTDFSGKFAATVNTAEDVAAVLKGFTATDDSTLADIAKLAKEYVTVEGKTSASSKITGVESGYYLIEETASSGVTSRYMLNVVGDATVTPKRVLPTLTKDVYNKTTKTWGEANTASTGDEVQYKLTSSVPDMTGYDKYFFIINDDLDEDHLAFTKKNDEGKDVLIHPVTVSVGGTELAADKYEVQIGDAAEGHTFQIVFKSFIDYKAQKGAAIVVTYSVDVKEDAATLCNGENDQAHKNMASLTYSNNPNTVSNGRTDDKTKHDPEDPDTPVSNPDEPEFENPGDVDPTNPETLKPGEPVGKTEEDIVYTYMTKIIVDKVEEGSTDTDRKPLPGAEFGLYSDEDCTNLVSRDITKNDGYINFEGLGEATYYLKEIKAPDGYNLNTDVTKIEITANPTASSAGWKYNETTNNTFKVINKKGSTLPSTGGIGTKLFYFFGSLLFGGSAVLLVTRKRMSAKED